jgi:pimeloyl-ACP methyl ester carboxylesterase
MSAQQSVRRDDLAFVLDQLEQTGALGPLTDRVDLARIVAAGHSFGGATAAALAEKDSRIRAAINIDGTPYGRLVTAKLPVPYLLIQSDFAETGHSERFLRGNTELLANAAPGSARHELRFTNHYSFTDLPLYFSPPARGLLSLVIGGSRGVQSTIHETNRLISAFIADAVQPRA